MNFKLNCQAVGTRPDKNADANHERGNGIYPTEPHGMLSRILPHPSQSLPSLVRLRLGLHHCCCNAATNGDNKRDRNKGNPHSTLLSSASTKPVSKRGSSRLVPGRDRLAFKKIGRLLCFT
jgi:hypothetical protein